MRFRSIDHPRRLTNLVLGFLATLGAHSGRVGDIILYDGRLAVYKHSLDLIFYLIANQDENELMISTALSAFSDAVHMLLRNQVEKRAVLENLDLVLLCLDETIDDGYVIQFPDHHIKPFSELGPSATNWRLTSRIISTVSS